MSATWQWAKANPDAAARRIRDLERENATLRAEALKTQIGQHAEIKNYAASVAELERENAALRADKDRLDWLEASDLWPAYLDFWPNHLPQLGGSLRAAIDAARKEEQP